MDDAEIQLTIDAECALLGAILLEGTVKNVILELREVINTNDFYSGAHRAIYSAMLQCELPHIVNVAYQMWIDGTYEKRGSAYLSHCIAVCPDSLIYMDYAKIVRNYADSRRGNKRTVFKRAI